MTLCVQAVDAGFASEASSILREAWSHQSAIDYTPEYIAWQFSFPGALPPLAFAAFENAEPIGFLGTTVRRLGLGTLELDAFCCSFWGMRPGRGGSGGALLLLDALLTALWSYQVPVLGFGVHDGRGQKVFPHMFLRAGFVDWPLGDLPSYGYSFVSAPAARSDWVVEKADSHDLFAGIVAECAAKDPHVLYCYPSLAQWEHYNRDPRDRQLLVATDTRTGARAAAWAIRSAIRSPRGRRTIRSLDSVILERSRPDALPAFLRAAAELDAMSGVLPAVNAPSLGGFDEEALKSLGIRRTSDGFVGHLYLAPSQTEWHPANATASEII